MSESTSAGTPSPAGEKSPAGDRLPLVPLALLAAVGFLLITLETLPAGLLPEIAHELGTSEGTVGLFVSFYAIGTVIVTVPAITITRSLPRKPLLLSAITIMIAANTAVALSPSIGFSLGARFIGGAMAGTIWAMFATYARSISPPRLAGRSLAVVSVGPPVGLALGTPLGALLGTVLDWRWSFVGLSALSAVVLALVIAFVPEARGRDAQAGLPLRRVVRIPGVVTIIAVIVAWMLAHNTIYTYISPYLAASTSGLSASFVLFLYGIAAIGGVFVTGALLDRRPRLLLHSSAVAFVAAAVVLVTLPSSPSAIVIASLLWGVAFGGASTQLQAFLTTAAGANADVASAFLPVSYNIAIFAAGILGAAVLTWTSGLALAAIMLVFGAIAAILTVVGRSTAFPKRL